MLKTPHFSGKRAILLTSCLSLLLAAAVFYLLRPKPFTAYVPADSIGYLEIPDAIRFHQLLHDRAFLDRALGPESSNQIRGWMDSFLDRLGLKLSHLSTLQTGAVITSATVEGDRTIKIHGVLVLRLNSFWARSLPYTSRSVAEKLSNSSTFITTESLRGQEVAVLNHSRPERQLWVMVKDNAVLVSNQREALHMVVTTLDGAEPCITASPSWTETLPKFSRSSIAVGFFVGPSVLNLLQNFLVRNYSPFEDAARTSRFLASLGLDRVQSITYDADKDDGRIAEKWEYKLQNARGEKPSFLSLFLEQKSGALGLISSRSIPIQATGARFISLKNSESMWKAFLDSLGVLTNQQAPQDRELVVAMFEGALGFRVQRDFLANISDAVAFVNLEDISDRPSAGKEHDGWVFIAPSKNPDALAKVFSKMISEDRPPRTMDVGNVKVFFSAFNGNPPGPLKGLWEGAPAFTIKDQALFFSPRRSILLSAIQDLQKNKPITFPTLPASIDAQAPYLSMNFRPGTKEGGTLEAVSLSAVTKTPEGFQYFQISSCGLLCDLVRQALEGIQ
jgi:hypothetical protein